MKTKNKEKLRLKKNKFLAGIFMQVVQAILITGIVLSLLDWSWFKIEYVYTFASVVILLGFNIVSWYLIISGLKESDLEEYD